MCRLVTCTPPWILDPACGTSSRTDNNTRFHDRPCLDEPFGGVELIADVGGAIRVTGWAINPADPFPTEVRVFANGGLVAVTAASERRPDVGFAYPHYGTDRGFDVTVVVSPGEQLVCVYAISNRTGVGRFLGFAVVEVSSPSGSIDLLEDRGQGVLRVGGWVIDPADLRAPATARFVVDGQVVSLFTAGDPRPDVGAVVADAGDLHGFTIDLPLGSGPHSVCLEAVGANSGPTLIICADVVLV